jgi:hypothetical protein
LRAVLVCHTVPDADGRLTAGYLVRCLASRREMGHVWWKPTPGAPSWFWRTPDALHCGERTTRDAAIEVLRDAFDLAHDVDRARRHPIAPTVSRPDVDASSSSRANVSPARTSSTRTASPTPTRVPRPPSTQQITWGPASSADLTAAVADALRKGRS